MRGRRKGLLGLLLSLTLLLSVYKPVCAQEEIGIGSVWKEYGLEEIGESLDRMLPGHGPDIRQILDNILAGRLGRAVELTWEGTGERLLSELAGMKHLFTVILILGILSALFAHFSDVFSNQQIADISFYFLYLLLAAVLMKAFQEAADITRQLVGDIVYFIRLFIPAYFMAVGAAVGAATAAAYYQLLLLLAYGAESLLFSFLLPLVYTYVLLALMNGIWAEERLSLLLDFLKKGISTGLKAAIGVITSFGIFQSMITPVLDSLKNSAVKKAISAIPGIGNLAEGVT